LWTNKLKLKLEKDLTSIPSNIDETSRWDSEKSDLEEWQSEPELPFAA